MKVGYIYVRNNESWDLYNAVKLGKTLNILDREQTYMTCEIKKGFYMMVIALDSIILDNVEKQLQEYLNNLNLNIKSNAGINFYKKEIINFVVIYLHKNNINYKYLSESEIKSLLIPTSMNDKVIKNNIEINNFDENDKKLIVKKTKRRNYPISYEEAKQIILSNNIKNKYKYFELCEKDNRLSNEPELTYRGLFCNWIEYLSIERIYYDLKTCIIKVNELLKIHSELKKHFLELSFVCEKLCELDNNFPPNGLWVEYYNLKCLSDIIVINIYKKKSIII